MTPLASSSAVALDTIQAYLDSPVMPADLLKSIGGSIAYWHTQEAAMPSLSRMGSEYCSAPGMLYMLHLKDTPLISPSIQAASVDSERSFSDARRKLGFMQYNTSNQTFKSSVAVGSWDGTPLFPTLASAIQIIQKSMERGDDTDNGD